MYATIKVTVGYSANGVSAADIESNLEQGLRHAINSGMLTGPHHEVTVDEYEVNVTVEEQGDDQP